MENEYWVSGGAGGATSVDLGALIRHDQPKSIPREALINYLRMKVDECDWHAVSDAANDLRVLEAKHGK